MNPIFNPGKMELFSKRFEKLVNEVFVNMNVKIVATIPIPKSRPIPIVEKIKSREDSKLFEISRANRDSLLSDLIGCLD